MEFSNGTPPVTIKQHIPPVTNDIYIWSDVGGREHGAVMTAVQTCC